MRPYEVMIILDPAMEEDAIRVEVDRSTELIRSGGGSTGRVDRWGRRRLAYELAKHREGYYVLIEASAEPAVMADLDRSLRLADRVLRHKVIRMPAQALRRRARPADGTTALAAPADDNLAAPADDNLAAPADDSTASAGSES